MSVLKLYVHTNMVRSMYHDFLTIAHGTELTVSFAQNKIFCIRHTIVKGCTSVPKIVGTRGVA